MNADGNMSPDMIYSMILNSIHHMNSDEMQNALAKLKGMLSTADYEKLLAIVAKERGKML